MLDPLAQQVGIGGAVAVLLVGTVMRFLPAFMAALKSQKNGNGTRSAGRTANEWDAVINKQVKSALEETKAQRHEDLERLLEKVLDKEFLKRNEVLRQLVREELKKRRGGS